jgi:hypothetical protein
VPENAAIATTKMAAVTWPDGKGNNNSFVFYLTAKDSPVLFFFPVTST